MCVCVCFTLDLTRSCSAWSCGEREALLCGASVWKERINSCVFFTHTQTKNIVSLCVCVSVLLHVFVLLHVCMCECVPVCVCVLLHVCMCECVCVFVWVCRCVVRCVG